MTTINEAFPSKWLKAADLKSRTIKLKINKVVLEEIGQDKRVKPVIYFDATEKGLVCNKINALTIAAEAGDEMDDWAGRELELFSQMVPFQGQNVPSIRVRVVTEQLELDPNDPIGI
ncbi:MAG: hypothetical protein O6924_07005 [Alphaproteobacteria bacterium]|nr:hypothetical protein [Alphaproteobacteria bacterium]